MKDFNLTAAQAAGVVGNLKHESGGMNPHINEIGSGDQTYGPPNFSRSLRTRRDAKRFESDSKRGKLQQATEIHATR